MKNKSIIIICGDPKSTFNEILIKTLKNKFLKNIKFPIIIICSKKLFKNELKKIKNKNKFSKILIIKKIYLKKKYILLIFLLMKKIYL